MSDLPTPSSRVERLLANLDGVQMSIHLPPTSNVEKYLAYICGVSGVELPAKPESNVEAYLEYMALHPAPTPPIPIYIDKTITANGEYNAEDDNADGYKKVTVTVPTPILDELVATVNGEYNPTHDGYSKVTVQVPDPVLETLSVTENGTYTAPSGKAYSPVTVNVSQRVNVYGFHIDGNESTPSEMVTYLEDAVGMTPAHMDYTNDTFDYGSWADTFIMRGIKPCILGMDGQVIKYLNPNDYTKDVDGNTVTIDDTLTDANVMIEFPKMWYKVVADDGDVNSGSVFIANAKLDEDYHDWAYIDYQGVHKEHFYMSAYNGSLVSNKLRSISNAQVMKTKTAANEITYAQANGNGWYTEDFGEIQLINFLLILMGKSVNTQAVFGQGIHADSDEIFNDGFRTGVHNTKGLFYGTNSNSASYSNAVKVFGIENWWGFQWRRYAGHMLVNGAQKIKLCYGREDGTTTDNYNTDGTGYITKGATPSGTNGSYISKMTFNGGVMLSSVSSGSSSTYYCDGQWFNNSASRYAVRGGKSGSGALAGAFYVTLNDTPDSSDWVVGAAASYK